MSEQKEVTIHLNDATARLFAEYEAFTRVTPEVYVQQLIEKTMPTLEAMVGALRDANGDEEAVMELFGKKMAESMLRQQQAQAS
ncbi:hypothetical protein [Oceanisphaera psychrotolerans]|uniref:Uncharacterized protein n=1 Tax=Oceanisphaera psychrotolerans TaxID=1414654 RepID=A0A1J4QCD7_9GAMM|nr:hypothetical protein [Oceanisphaera psychrotolerans]OIN03797.1 hypothetical protein BFR47_07420 [Oceanisphaera psychrotolerans]